MSPPIGKVSLSIVVYLRTEYPYNVALLSVYDKTNLIDLATALSQSGVRLLASGGTAKKIRDAGLAVECVLILSVSMISQLVSQGCRRYHQST